MESCQFLLLVFRITQRDQGSLIEILPAVGKRQIVVASEASAPRLQLPAEP